MMKEFWKDKQFSTMQILAIGFLGVIFLGGILLYLPVSNQQPISFLDALFTSTTAVCVTGLVTVVPATQFTLFGKIILLLLIQIGGLGIIACMIGFFIILKKRISIRERILIQETYNMTGLTGMIAFVLKILKGTFVAEGIGAILYSFQFVPEYGLEKGIAYSIFHSVSAFCNAGIDILGNDSFMRYTSNPIINITTMLLIVMGGLGFIVWFDVRDTYKKVSDKRRFWAKLSLHSKLVLVMTGGMIVLGTLFVLVLEFHNPDTIGNLPIGEKIMASMFHSVSTRTAGFATVSQVDLRAGTKFLSSIWMFIGGSPCGTAGGVKTTTIAMLLLTCVNVMYGKRDTECFGRKVPDENFRTGFSVVLMGYLFLMVGMVGLTVLEPEIDFLNLMYEGVSAIATVGLTADVTGRLGDLSKIVIMCMMYIGRLGPVTVALIFGTKKNRKERVRQLAEQRIIVG